MLDIVCSINAIPFFFYSVSDSLIQRANYRPLAFACNYSKCIIWGKKEGKLFSHREESYIFFTDSFDLLAKEVEHYIQSCPYPVINVT